MNAIVLEREVCAQNYAPLPIMLSHGEGVWLTDVAGVRRLDMMSGYSAVSLGHGHPRILKVLNEQARRLAVTSRAFHTEPLGPFLAKLCAVAGQEMALPMNTGAEAVETAIKAARRWGHKVKGIADGRAQIIVADNNFHGRTTTIVGFSTDESYRDGFGPFAPGFVSVPFGDAAAMEAAITPNTAAILIEPIQGEAGIVLPPDGYLRALRALCDRHNVLLILDEIQSGLGRTGYWFAHQHEGVKPDGLIVGKALGGGVYPVSAFLASRAVMQLFGPGSHGSTFGGNALAAAIGFEALAVIEDEKLVERSAELGAYMKQRLVAMTIGLASEVRGRGLWIGVEIASGAGSAKEIVARLADAGVLTKETHEHTIRFAPPLTISRQELDWGLERCENVFTSLAR
ncbi:MULTISPECIES: ornithine--oxo-acid transaminase [unclassified Bosea (in: a-proteobacteria)]|uniref:ornithine--oxo-acid transaminase n=1 Tax=unclassified Bosea (in: a-proteobacteria) TaxID=2653178 RepID=UPI000F75CBEE|nr:MULTISPECIES: ornithine--oxo-acid transaminase [unclassified Bosea (in: a-proteobacteria)]AZO78174.1 ornithine--oxo-acid transaminase [Bosea sp. Tri-49]RXT20341.1 ornithine--oxo-acid transaminase [Bosea sp. Tri-39]RXT37213.1 ornithine--oxo-acid transaminase [Bosea sp. Tri-54]